jgi:hypothetical protein
MGPSDGVGECTHFFFRLHARRGFNPAADVDRERHESPRDRLDIGRRQSASQKVRHDGRRRLQRRFEAVPVLFDARAARARIDQQRRQVRQGQACPLWKVVYLDRLDDAELFERADGVDRLVAVKLNVIQFQRPRALRHEGRPGVDEYADPIHQRRNRVGDRHGVLGLDQSWASGVQDHADRVGADRSGELRVFGPTNAAHFDSGSVHLFDDSDLPTRCDGPSDPQSALPNWLIWKSLRSFRGTVGRTRFGPVRGCQGGQNA